MAPWLRRLGLNGIPLLAAVLMVVSPARVSAQLPPVELWLRPVLAVPIGDFAGRDEGIDAGVGFGFDVGGSLDLGPAALYVEYQHADLACGECEEVGLEDHALDRGWGGGVIVPIPYGVDRFRPWVRAGISGHRLGFQSGDDTRYSDTSVGWAVGAGAVTDLLPWLGVEPTLLVRSYEARFEFAADAPARETRVSFLAAGLTLRIRPAAF